MTLLALAVAWLAAIVTVAAWSAPGWALGGFIAALIPAAALGGRRAALPLLAAMALVAIVGGLRFESWATRDTATLGQFSGRTVALEGVIDSEPRSGETTRSYEVDVERVRLQGSWAEISGRVLVTLSQYTRLLPSTPVRLSGELAQAPIFPDFDYRAFLERRDIVGTMLFPRVDVLSPPGAWSPARRVTELRLDLEDALGRSLPEPEASLAAGIAFGRDDGLPDDLYADFRDAGIAHIVAVSGANVSIAAAIVFLLTVPVLGRRWALLPAVAAIAAYVVLAGLSGSVVRAGIMASVFLAGEWLGRPRSSLAALAAAAVVITAFQPSAAVDVGFQLSFAATAGLIVFGPWIRWAFGRAALRFRVVGLLPASVATLFSMTLAANFATLPIVWTTFGRVSVVGLVVNLIVEPLFLVSFAGSLAAGFAGLAWQPAGWAVGLVAYYPLAATTGLARWFAALPFAAVDLPPASTSVAIAAGALLSALGLLAYGRLPADLPARRPAPPLLRSRLVPLVALAAGFAVLVVRISRWPLDGPGELEIAFLDVGQGDAILVTTPHRHRVLIDGGPSGIVLARQLGAVLPHWERNLDMVILTHPQQDHLGGLPLILDRFDAARTFDDGLAAESEGWRMVATATGDSRRSLHAGDAFDLDGASFRVVWPPPGFRDANVNDSSLVLLVQLGDVRILLTGDLEASAQERLIAGSDVTATVLKVPHHGAKTSSPSFFAAVHPTVAVVSVGAGNSFGHPASETLDALRSVATFRTDRDGRVTVRTDGHSLRIETSHGSAPAP